MFPFIIYESKVAAILAAFYLCFKWLLADEKMHRANRIILVGTSVLSFILPLCIITIHRAILATQTVISGFIQPAESGILSAPAMSWKLFVIALYWLGVASVLGSTLLGIIKVMKLIKNGEEKEIDGTVITVCDSPVPPFSWMKWIVLSRADFESGNRHILEHEKAHIRFGHSREILLFDVLSAFQWFNPAVWLLRKDLRAIHEYEADDAVLRKGADIREYQYSLIRKAVSASGYSITNSFNHSILKKRITMMSKSNASRMKRLRVLYILPLVCGTLALNARTVSDCESSENQSKEQVSNILIQAYEKDGKAVYHVNGEEIPFDGIAGKVEALMAGVEYPIISLGTNLNIESDSFKDLMNILSKIGALKVNISDKEALAQSYNYNTEPAPGVHTTDEIPTAFTELAKRPSFNGGNANDFANWVAKNVHYPESAKAAGIQGTVLISFKVNSDGKVSDVTVRRGINDALDNEAVRVVCSSPDWIPGEVDGKPVATVYTFPVMFALRQDNSTQK